MFSYIDLPLTSQKKCKLLRYDNAVNVNLEVALAHTEAEHAETGGLSRLKTDQGALVY